MDYRLRDELRPHTPLLNQAPWPRYLLSRLDWAVLLERLEHASWEVLALWGDSLGESVSDEIGAEIHLALHDPNTNDFATITFVSPDGRFPSVARVRPDLAAEEAAVTELTGLTPVDPIPTAEAVTALDHGRWRHAASGQPRKTPLSAHSLLHSGPTAEASAPQPAVPASETAQPSDTASGIWADVTPIPAPRHDDSDRSALANIPQASRPSWDGRAPGDEDDTGAHPWLPLMGTRAGCGLHPAFGAAQVWGQVSNGTIDTLRHDLGYAHRGITALMRGKPLRDAAGLAARLSGETPVAHALAFSLAVEAALGLDLPEDALWLRMAAAELERVRCHSETIESIASLLDRPEEARLAERLRDDALRCADMLFGQRLMPGIVVPGGLAHAIATRKVLSLADEYDSLRDNARILRRKLRKLADKSPELRDPELASSGGMPGPAGRAAGARNDARHTPGYAPYDVLRLRPVWRDGGSGADRLLVIASEIGVSARMVRSALSRLSGSWLAAADTGDNTALEDRPITDEGVALVEAPHGATFAWVRVAPNRTVAHIHFRDASWSLWPAREHVARGLPLAALPLLTASLPASAAARDG